MKIMKNYTNSSNNPSTDNDPTDYYYQIHVTRYQKIFEKVRSLNLQAKSKVLDIGCYPPYLLDFSTKQNFDTYGICSRHETVNHPQVSILNVDNDSLPYKDDQFDLIVMSEVLEHLTGDPVNIFSEIYRVLKPGGYFLLTTPNVLRIQNVISLLIGKNIYFDLDQLKNSSQKLGTIYFRHNREYSKNELSVLLKKSGFFKTNNEYFISYTPFRAKNKFDSIILKTIKYLNYLAMHIFYTRKDTILLLTQK